MRPEIELFDLSHIHGARRLIDAGLMDERPHVQVVMGVKNALPAEEHLLDLMLGEIQRVLPKATWTAAGIGVNQARVMEWVLARGGARRADRARGQHPGQQGPAGGEQRRAGAAWPPRPAAGTAAARRPRRRRAPRSAWRRSSPGCVTHPD